MSEFSESYHLRTDDSFEAVSLLRRAGLVGYVYPDANGWVTLLPEGAPFEPNEQLIRANTGVLLHYIYAEDHGWGIELHRSSDLLMTYECHWGEDIEVTGILNVGAFDQAAGTALSSIDPEEQRRLLAPSGIEEVFAVGPARAFSRLVGLKHTEWVSFDYLSRDEDRGRPLPPGVVAVR